MKDDTCIIKEENSKDQDIPIVQDSQDKYKEIKLKEISFVYNHCIERVWLFLREMSLFSLIKKSEDNIINFGDSSSFEVDAWDLDKEIECVLFEKHEAILKCVKKKDFPHLKKIGWRVTFKEDPKYYLQFSICLMKITQNNTSVSNIKFKSNYAEIVNTNLKNYETITKDVQQLINKKLVETSKDLFQFEACMISAKMEDIWEYVADHRKLKNIAPKINDDHEINFAELKLNEEIKIFVKDKYFTFKLICYRKKAKLKTWSMAVEVNPGTLVIPRQIITVALSQISEDDCLVCIYHELKDPITQENIEKLCREKKYLLTSLKDFLENYKN